MNYRKLVPQLDEHVHELLPLVEYKQQEWVACHLIPFCISSLEELVLNYLLQRKNSFHTIEVLLFHPVCHTWNCKCPLLTVNVEREVCHLLLHNNFCTIVEKVCKCLALMGYMPDLPMKTVSCPHQLYPAAGTSKTAMKRVAYKLEMHCQHYKKHLSKKQSEVAVIAQSKKAKKMLYFRSSKQKKSVLPNWLVGQIPSARQLSSHQTHISTHMAALKINFSHNHPIVSAHTLSFRPIAIIVQKNYILNGLNKATVHHQPGIAMSSTSNSMCAKAVSHHLIKKIFCYSTSFKLARTTRSKLFSGAPSKWYFGFS